MEAIKAPLGAFLVHQGEGRDKLTDALSGTLGSDVVAASLAPAGGGVAGVMDKSGVEHVFSVTPGAPLLSLAEGTLDHAGGYSLSLGRSCPANLPALLAAMPSLTPGATGLAPSFGFGDRIGLATPGHAAAMRAAGEGLVPIFCQQSIREMTRTRRTPPEVMSDAVFGALRSGWTGPTGADADHLKTFADVDVTAASGFVFFTIDPSDHVDQNAGGYDGAELEKRFEAMVQAGQGGAEQAAGLYEGKSFDLGTGAVAFDRQTLYRAVVKYGRALDHIQAMAAHIAEVRAGKPWEIEVSVDETEEPTSVAEHCYIAMELKRRGVAIVSLAPRFPGAFEKGVDYRGDLRELRDVLARHAAVAERFGPYKLSLHSGSDKFGVYPLLAKATRGVFHVKTAGTSYLEALRVACRADPDLFREIVGFSRARFDTDKASYHISAVLGGSSPPERLDKGVLEAAYLGYDNGRQILHVTFGSVLTAPGARGGPSFRERLAALLKEHRALHEEVLRIHFERHLRPLTGA
ncbi:hypothetical protein NNJEOMEG_03721 [Fundidesulfovibrio magnetotacticus]|uniref:Tagaturonate/fructuronate epimerase n=1 Tax=Fundidesulfovibrio magnetotacticus TaxID=2730080 RepID=A0A6V8M0T5_9BACT|nr:tagaturonate epimerase family protein [Fundidesulfovibrio magnetotacticus]GFK95849.1 hypothetical protein NNJEOMEG_03721 [Fundidesulfovibrio magnetotacticus]